MKTQPITITKTKLLMRFQEMIAVYSENDTKPDKYNFVAEAKLLVSEHVVYI